MIRDGVRNKVGRGVRGKGNRVPVHRTRARGGETRPYLHYASTPGLLKGILRKKIKKLFKPHTKCYPQEGSVEILKVGLKDSSLPLGPKTPNIKKDNKQQ